MIDFYLFIYLFIHLLINQLILLFFFYFILLQKRRYLTLKPSLYRGFSQYSRKRSSLFLEPTITEPTQASDFKRKDTTILDRKC
ncbi:hypothetical protein BDV26DRAFT_269311 [Aspergillus bertholletiae]|uniref:Uncharacterized protein n=1 Tax=Aspergillus bertholletiae TaxID=1226010 RepID=A0A5N7AYG4_9EURO|nr:hypothetical protein BDV26DRAFT_269311 [Aspergillus bertholletiae]